MRRPSPALVVSVVALVVALGGTAFAAKKYVITSTKQISPKVLQQLRGRTGPMGPTGLQGPRGTDGTAGPAGSDGPAGPSKVVSMTRADIAALADNKVAELTALPAGQWLVVATLSSTNGSPTTLTCQIEGQPGSSIAVSDKETQLTTSAALDLALATNVRLLCTSGSNPAVRAIRLYAIRTGELDRRSS
jgi:hypothetical protein